MKELVLPLSSAEMYRSGTSVASFRSSSVLTFAREVEVVTVSPTDADRDSTSPDTVLVTGLS